MGRIEPHQLDRTLVLGAGALISEIPFPGNPAGENNINTMNELTAEEYESVNGGLAPLVVALLGGVYLWADSNWADIKKGAIDGWNDTTR
jgi:hypothetical protein